MEKVICQQQTQSEDVSERQLRPFHRHMNLRRKQLQRRFRKLQKKKDELRTRDADLRCRYIRLLSLRRTARLANIIPGSSFQLKRSFSITLPSTRKPDSATRGKLVQTRSLINVQRVSRGSKHFRMNVSPSILKTRTSKQSFSSFINRKRNSGMDCSKNSRVETLSVYILPNTTWPVGLPTKIPKSVGVTCLDQPGVGNSTSEHSNTLRIFRKPSIITNGLLNSGSDLATHVKSGFKRTYC